MDEMIISGRPPVHGYKTTIDGAVQTTGATYTIRGANDGTYDYFGFATPGTATSAASWQIKRVDSSANTLFADGNSNFDNIWDNYASLSYS